MCFFCQLTQVARIHFLKKGPPKEHVYSLIHFSLMKFLERFKTALFPPTHPAPQPCPYLGNKYYGFLAKHQHLCSLPKEENLQ